MTIVKSKFVGFCPGVVNSINIIKNAKNKYDKVFTSSIIVHNRNIAQDLGVKSLDNKIDNLSTIKDSAVVVSAHGARASFKDVLKQNRVKIFDATCPVVQQNIDNAIEQDCDIIYIGLKEHSECKFFLDNVKASDIYNANKRQIIVLQSFDDLKVLDKKAETLKSPQVYVQTTFSMSQYQKICEGLKNFFNNFDLPIAFFKGICPDCLNRRQDVLKLSKIVDAIVVVGDYISSNAKELCSIATTVLGNDDVYLIKNHQDSMLLKIKNKYFDKKVGIISSASSSAELFDGILNFLQE